MARLDHVNARIGARRSRLLGADGLRELLVRPSLAARIELLAQRGRIVSGPLPAEGDGLLAVERALRSAVREEERRLLDEVEGPGARRLLAAAIALGEAQGLKQILRGIAHGLPADRLAAGAALGPGEEGLPALAGAASLDDLVGRLRAQESPFAEPIGAALAERDRAALLPAEVAIDRVAAGRVAAAAVRAGEDGAALLEWLAERVDVRNATTLLALGAATPARDLFVPGGRRISAAAFALLARGGVEARRAAAAALVPCPAEQLLDPAGAERLLERSAARRLTLAARRRPLSLAVPLAWLEARREEVRRIAIVLRGAALGLPGDAILDLVEA